jgi:hypothetical protein
MNGCGQTLRRAWLGVLGGVLGCSGTQGPSGPPVLVGVDVFDATGSPLMLEAGGGTMPISPRISFAFRFDRLLDPELLEEIMDGKPVGSTDVAVIEAAGDPGALTTYIPNGHGKHKLVFPGGPALIVSPQPTLPSGAPVKVSLDKSRIQSKDGASPFLLSDGISESLSFSTEPFGAVIAPMVAPAAGQPLPGKSTLAITFNNLPAEGIEDSITIEVFDSAGTPLPEVEGKLAADATDPTRWVVAPAAESWPAGARIRITVDQNATDALGMQMKAEVAGAFEVVP